MSYTEKDFARMEGNSELTRQYVWKVAMGAKSRAIKLKNKARKTPDEVDDMEREESWSELLFSNMDVIVEYLMRK